MVSENSAIPQMKIKQIHRRLKASRHKPWQIYLLSASVLAALGLYLEIEITYSVLQAIERVSSRWSWVIILGIQGVLIGFVAEFLYEQGDGYAKSTSHLFTSKDQTLLFRVGAMTLVSGVITKVVPPLLENATEFLFIQTTGAVIALGILLVHIGSSDWNPLTEWPAITAGTLLAIVPSLV